MFIEPSVVSIIIAKIRGGTFRNIENFKLRGIYLLFLSAAIQFFLSFAKARELSFSKLILEDLFIYLIFLSYLLIIIAILLNLNKAYMKVFLIGVVLNMAVILANGGKMPVSLNGISGINQEMELPDRQFDIKHTPVTEDTRLVYLSDILLIPKPYPLPKILSVGDLFIMTGIFVFFQKEMLSEKKK